jgi:antitoxin FitA
MFPLSLFIIAPNSSGSSTAGTIRPTARSGARGSGAHVAASVGIDYSAIIDCIPGRAAELASITIRNLDEQTKARLKVRAAHRKRSMEEEARNILRAALAEDSRTPHDLAEAIRRRFRPLGGVVLRLPPREPMREPPRLDT